MAKKKEPTQTSRSQSGVEIQTLKNEFDSFKREQESRLKNLETIVQSIAGDLDQIVKLYNQFKPLIDSYLERAKEKKTSSSPQEGSRDLNSLIVEAVITHMLGGGRGISLREQIEDLKGLAEVANLLNPHKAFIDGIMGVVGKRLGSLVATELAKGEGKE